jgi:hypothetical protein
MSLRPDFEYSVGLRMGKGAGLKRGKQVVIEANVLGGR